MARVSGPLMSVGASGTFAKTLTYATWKGRSYVRQRVIPANPKTSSQTGIRAMFGYVAAAWAGIAALSKATWDAAAVARGISAFNAYASQCMTDWQNGLAPIQASTDARTTGDVVCALSAITGAAGYATMQISNTADAAADAVGFIIFRDTAEITDPSWTNAIAVVPWNPSNDVVYTDSPLAAGTYHYRTAAFSADGKLGTVTDDGSCVVT